LLPRIAWGILAVEIAINPSIMRAITMNRNILSIDLK
jgi:hypothetical protein